MAQTNFKILNQQPKQTIKTLVNQLKVIANQYDITSVNQKTEILQQLSARNFPLNRILHDVVNVLLFLSAHPSNKSELKLTRAELKRLGSTFKKLNSLSKKKFENSGLPYTNTLTTFSHDFLEWLSCNTNTVSKIDSFYKSKINLTDSLAFTLPSLEKEYLGMAANDKELLNLMNVSKEQRLEFILTEYSKLNQNPFLKDYFFNALHVYINVKPLNEKFSKVFNQLNTSNYYFHHDILKQFDQKELLDRKLPPSKKLEKQEFERINEVIKFSLALLQRETDPVTYMDENSFQFFELERGVSIAIYGMTPNRQLPLESYVGYTLFKNGYPAAYGGAWVFGKRSLFGINIFEPYRGGESGYMMCQLLRVYHQCFKVDYFEVEPYQYGLGNPEGISSGAYWFYYRFGFRSLHPELEKLASKEFETIKTKKGYRSSQATLVRFTESNVALQMGTSIPITVAEIREKVTSYISNDHQGNRLKAEHAVRENLCKKLRKNKTYLKTHNSVFSETAFLCEVLKINSPSKLKLIEALVISKSQNLYAYQELLLKLIS